MTWEGDATVDVTDWLSELCGDGLTGFMPPAMPDAVWVLNAMYEHEQGPGDASYGETWNRLVGILAEQSPTGADTPCLAYYNPLMLGALDFDSLHVRSGRLGDAEALYDNPEADFSPSNFWAEDRSWVLCSDYDLWATKVAGTPALIEALLNDPEIEAIRLPWTPEAHPRPADRYPQARASPRVPAEHIRSYADTCRRTH